MRPTLQTIADYAGVSRGTVDRVLHCRPKVSEKNRRKVEEALRKLNYAPNAAARCLALSVRNMKIAVVAPTWDLFYLDEVRHGVEGAQRSLHNYGLEIILRTFEVDSPEHCIRVIDELVEDGVRGISLCAKNSQPVREKVASLVQSGFPVITFNSDLPGTGRLCFVGQEELKSGRTAADIMLKLVRRDQRFIVVLGNPEFEANKERVEGFFSRLAEQGVPRECCHLVTSYNDYDITLRKVGEHLQQDPAVNGLYLANNSTTGGVEAVRRAGRLDGVRIVCHDVPESTAELLREGAVDFSVDQNLYRQGFLPVSMLGNLLMAGIKPERDFEFTPIRIVGPENIHNDSINP